MWEEMQFYLPHPPPFLGRERQLKVAYLFVPGCGSVDALLVTSRFFLFFESIRLAYRHNQGGQDKNKDEQHINHEVMDTIELEMVMSTVSFVYRQFLTLYGPKTHKKITISSTTLFIEGNVHIHFPLGAVPNNLPFLSLFGPPLQVSVSVLVSKYSSVLLLHSRDLHHHGPSDIQQSFHPQSKLKACVAFQQVAVYQQTARNQPATKDKQA